MLYTQLNVLPKKKKSIARKVIVSTFLQLRTTAVSRNWNRREPTIRENRPPYYSPAVIETTIDVVEGDSVDIDISEHVNGLPSILSAPNFLRVDGTSVRGTIPLQTELLADTYDIVVQADE